MELLLSILKFIAKVTLSLGSGILWILSIFDIFGIAKAFNGKSGKDSIASEALTDLPDNSDLNPPRKR